jgi:cysteine desulfurase
MCIRLFIMKNIYLDANANSLALPCAQEKLIENLTVLGNPSSFHKHGQLARSLLDEARTNIAKALECQTKSVIFTSGASESNKLFLDSLIKKNPYRK